MKPISCTIHFYDIFQSLIRKRQYLEEEYFQNPTKENEVRVNSVRHLIKHYEELIQGNLVPDIWN